MVYLIELRIRLTKYKIKSVNKQISHDFRVPVEKIPHISLFGPFTLKNNVTEHVLKSHIENIVKKYNSFPFQINGFERRQGLKGDVIAHHIDTTEQIKEVKLAFINDLNSITNTKGMGDGDFSNTWFHVTVAKGLSKNKSEQIWKHLTSTTEDINDDISDDNDSFFHEIIKKLKDLFSPDRKVNQIYPLFINEDILRIALIKGPKILAEYDLLQRKWLSRSFALSSSVWGKSLADYRRQIGIELINPSYRPDEIFVIGDTHFGHANIIDYCARPFIKSHVSEMDSVMINNWNLTVAPEDRVIFLGDVKYGALPKNPQIYLKRLNGKKHLIKGNHDDPRLIPGMLDNFEMTYRDIKFLFIHNPSIADPNYDGWIIHGHVHNNNLRKYPFFNPAKKMVNVSVEVVNYQPIPLSFIYNLIKTNNEPILTLNKILN